MCDCDKIIREINKVAFSENPIPRDIVRGWMECSDLRVQYHLWVYILLSSDTRDRITPPLDSDEAEAFHLDHLARCIRENPPYGIAHDRDEAADEILTLFWDHEEDLDEQRERYGHLKSWLRELYVRSEEPVRAAIENRVLSRLFEYCVWRNFFADWADDSFIGQVYKRAVETGLSRSDEETINTIIATLGSSEPIPLVLARSWMLHENLEVQGAFDDYILCNKDTMGRIEPPVGSNEIGEFMYSYYGRCVMENPTSKHSMSRYDAAHGIMAWFLFCDGDIPPWVDDAKMLVARLYLAGDVRVRDAIVIGCLGYIFSKEQWREFFSDWKDDPVLAEAYDQGIEHILPKMSELPPGKRDTQGSSQTNA